jgi:hypothetical protein
MPRKKTIQPDPDEILECGDMIIEIRGHTSQIIERGWDKKYKAEELRNQILLGLIDDLQSQNQKRIEKARKALANNSTLARFMELGGYDGDERTLRNHAKEIRNHLIRCIELQEKHLSHDDPKKIKYILHPPK